MNAQHHTIGSRSDPRARMRDRAQTIRRAGRISAWREGKPGGCPAPAV